MVLDKSVLSGMYGEIKAVTLITFYCSLTILEIDEITFADGGNRAAGGAKNC